VGYRNNKEERMRRGIVGAVILACVLVLGGTALADVELSDDVTLSGEIELSIAGPDFALDTDVDWALEVISGGFEALFEINYDLDGAVDLDTTVSYVGSELAEFTVSTDTDVDLYDLNGDLLKDEAGLKVSSEYLTLWIGNTLEDDEVKWDIGVDLEYEMDAITLGARVLNFGDTEITGYAGQIEADLEPLALTVQYGSLDEDSAYFVEGEYGFGDASITASYLMDFVEKTTIETELEYPVTDIVGLTLSWEGETPKDGDMSSTIGAELEASLTDEVTGTLSLESVEGEDMTYEGIIEIEF